MKGRDGKMYKVVKGRWASSKSNERNTSPRIYGKGKKGNLMHLRSVEMEKNNDFDPDSPQAVFIEYYRKHPSREVKINVDRVNEQAFLANPNYEKWRDEVLTMGWDPVSTAREYGINDLDMGIYPEKIEKVMKHVGSHRLEPGDILFLFEQGWGSDEIIDLLKQYDSLTREEVDEKLREIEEDNTWLDLQYGDY